MVELWFIIDPVDPPDVEFIEEFWVVLFLGSQLVQVAAARIAVSVPAGFFEFY
jgi:hypothetical protein